MFTGIVEELGTVRYLQRRDKGYELAIYAQKVLGGTILGDSICVNGVCLTVTSLADDGFTVGLAPETRQRTNLESLKPGSQVNLERSVTPTSRMGGHFVQGHVDGVGEIIEFRKDEDALWVTIKVIPSMMKYIVDKGFITLDGTSLTVVDTTADSFTVSLIAYTQLYIILPQQKVGYRVNVEVDVLGKYVEKMMSHVLGGGETAQPKSGMTRDFLNRYGYG